VEKEEIVDEHICSSVGLMGWEDTVLLGIGPIPLFCTKLLVGIN
jgi:hypothetical protein